MDGTIMVVVITAIGCGTATVLTFIDKVFGGKSKQLQEEVKVEKTRVRMLEVQLADSHRQNDQLQKQVEWHTKMLDTQDRLMKQLADSAGSGAGSSAERPTVGSRS